MIEPTIIRRFSFRHQADLVQSVLAANGIDAIVMSDDCGSVDPALAMVRGVHVVVAAEDVARAEDVLAGSADGTDAEPES